MKMSITSLWWRSVRPGQPPGRILRPRRAGVLLALASGAASSSAAPLPTTPAQVAPGFGPDAAAARTTFLDREMQVAGTAGDLARSSFPGSIGTHCVVDPPCPEVAVQCPIDEANCAALGTVHRDSVVTVGGTATEQARPRTPRFSANLDDPPLSEDAGDHWTGASGFGHQSGFTLLSRTAYRVDAGAPGTSVDVAGSNQLRFTTGPLRGYAWLSATFGRNADGPTFAPHPAGPDQVLDPAVNGRSQSAFLRPPAAP